MFNDFLQPIDLIQDRTSPSMDMSKVFVDQLVENIINKDRQLKFECKILPYDEKKDGEEIFKCPLCDEENIEGRKALTEHLHRHQIQFKPCDGKHLCCLCGKELSSNSSLERHLLTHSNHRPFDCQVCGKKFTTNGNLSRHVKASHSTESSADSLSQVPRKFSMNENISPQSSPPRTPLSSILMTTPVFNRWPLQNIPLPSTNEVFLKILENSLKAYKNVLYSSESQTEILNLSKKTVPIIEQSPCVSLNLFPSEDRKADVTLSNCKKMAMKISQKYRGRRYNYGQKFNGNQTISLDTPLDLSVHGTTTPMTVFEQNSFLCHSPDEMTIFPLKSEVSSADFSCSFRQKKNSYKDAPKLIRCPMLGCTQKFPWNSSLMRHILTHTAHKPFRCIRCSKCFSTKSNRERHMHRVHGIKVNRHMIRNTMSPESSLSGMKEEPDLVELHGMDGFLSEKEWLEMSSSDRQAEDISHNLLKQAGEPVIEPNPFRQHSQMKMHLKIT